MKKKTFDFKWIMLVVLSLMCFQQAEAYDVQTGGLYFNVTEYSDGRAVASVQNNGSFNTYSGYVVIPDSITFNGKRVPVTGIGYQAFKGCTGLTGVLIPEGVTMMLNEAFSGCTSLVAITLPTTMYSIYNNVFTGCTNLMEIRCMRPTAISCNANNFDQSTYSNAELYVPYGSLESYQNTAPWSQFAHKTQTQQFVVDGICYRRMGNNNVKVTFKDTSYGSYQGNIIVPPTVTYNGVTYNVVAVDNHAFYGCTSLYSVELPSTITSIGENAFSGLSNFVLRCMTLEPPSAQNNSFPSSITEDMYLYLWIPYGSEQTYLDAVGWSNFGENFIFGTYDFIEDGNYYHITSPTTVSECAKAFNPFTYTFFYRDDAYTITDATIPAMVTHEDVTYQVTEVGIDAFGGCYNLKTVTLPEGIQKIGFGAFYDDRDLESINFPHTLTEIDDWAFIYNTSLTEIDIPNSVKTIGHSAFYQCYGLRTITLGSGLEWVGDEAFDVGSALETVTCNALIPPVTPEPDPQYYDVGLFSVANYNNARLYVPSSSLSAYKTATEWKNFKTIVPFVTLDEALNVSGGTLRFDGVGDYPWQVITEGGRDYAISTNAGASSTSSVLTTTVTVNSPSTLSFDYMAWGEGSATHWDACRFAVDGVVMFDEGALDNDWATFSTELQPGTHTLTWSYTKDGSVNPSGDYFAIDNVSLASALRGDVNGNGEVDINDVTMLIDVVLGKNVAYDPAAADCNIEGGNDNVDINDVTALINYVLRGTW